MGLLAIHRCCICICASQSDSRDSSVLDVCMYDKARSFMRATLLRNLVQNGLLPGLGPNLSFENPRFDAGLTCTICIF